MVVLAAHQPDFLPYSGFFYKMWKADVFDLAIWDAYSHSSYHRRCHLGDEWLSLHVPRKANQGVPLVDARYRWKQSRDRIAASLAVNLFGLPYRVAVRSMVMAVVDAQPVEDDGLASLVGLNSDLIFKIRGLLGITTPVKVFQELQSAKAHGILELMDFYDADTYLSGVGGKTYIPDGLFESSGFRLVWSKHEPLTSSSIVMVMASTSEPMEMVTREKDD